MLGQQENDLETAKKTKRMSEEMDERMYPVPNARRERGPGRCRCNTPVSAR